MQWFLNYQPDLARLITIDNKRGRTHHLLAIPTQERLRRILKYLLDENEFFSPYGFRADGQEYRVDYLPGEGNTYLFGGRIRTTIPDTEGLKIDDWSFSPPRPGSVNDPWKY